MKNSSAQSGFTVIELLITLFIAAAFLVAGFQLYSAIIKDGGQTRGEARASNVAYDYLRRYTGLTSTPCVASTPVNNSAITVSGISSVIVNVTISCPYVATTTISKINVTVTYNNPTQTVKYSTYVKK
jgi:prepilin-type N-terminal cleavage/methylation domain-containing protein